MTKARGVNAVIAVGALAFLYVPLLAVALFSFNNARHGFTWRGFTTRWYDEVFSDPRMWDITRNTLVLAAVSTVVSTFLGTALALGIHRFPWRRRTRLVIEGVLQVPVVMPDILFAVGLVVAFGALRSLSPFFNPELRTMILGHVSFQIAFVALVVRGRLATLGNVYEEAARDLYSERWNLFRRVTLPLMMPGVVAGAMLAFTLSLDDFVISLFTSSSSSTTLPLEIYSSLRRGLSPRIHAVSTMMLLVTVLLVLGVEMINRNRKG